MKPRLKALELHGYKTFASRVQFEFPGNVTAIVGPNGSGKSNIADALRWVLGEQSYSLLRGKKTEDMIFAGSDQRPRAGMASATITFDNEDGWLPIDYSDVAVARKAYRDGGNEYVINKQRVRLKDVSELLAKSGLAERTYTIIGQGLVDAALSLRPEERRRFFEEAAGIGLFRSRREESLNRLDATRRNLERIQDILSELDPRLRSLERQAKRAEEYDRVKADLHVLLKDWYGFHWQNTQKDLLRNKEILANQELKVGTARQKRIEIEKKVDVTRVRLQELREFLNQWHGESAGLHSRRENVSKALAVLDERMRSLDGQVLSLKNELIIADEGTISQTEKLSELLVDKQRMDEELSEYREQLGKAQTLFNERQGEREKIEAELRTERKMLVEAETKQVQIKAHQRELQSRLETQLASQKSLKENSEKGASELEALEAALREIENLEQKAQKDVLNVEEEMSKHEIQVKKTEEQEKHQRNEISQLEAQIARSKAQLEVIEQADQSLSGIAEGAKSLLQASKNGSLKGKFKAISGLLDVPADFEIAIGSALGELLDAVIMDFETDSDSTLEYLEKAENGRAVLVPSIPLINPEKIKKTNVSGVIGIASDLVKAPPEYHGLITHLLGQVLVVEDRKTAKTLLKSIPASGKVVTLRGEVFNGNGVIVAGKDKRSSIVGRPRQRKDLQDIIGNLIKSKEKIYSEYEQITSSLENYEEQKKSIVSKLGNLKKEFEERNSKYLSALRNLDQHKQKIEWQNSQLLSINEQIIRTSEEIKAIEDNLNSGSEEILAINASLREKNNLIHQMPMDELQAQLVHWNTTLAVSDRALKEAERRYEEFRQRMSENQLKVEQLKVRLSELQKQLDDVDAERKISTKQEGEINKSLEAAMEKIDPAEKELNQLESDYSRLQHDYSISQQFETNTDRVYTQAQMEMVRSREGLDTLRRKIEEDFGLVALEYSEDVTGPTPLPLDGVNQLVTLTEIPQELEDSINRQRALMRRMGAINPDAQKEYYEVKERHEFLSSQMTDLQKADNDLRQIIAELDEMMRQEFRKTFNAVAAEFKVMFTRLFGGGSARLVMTDDENPTETGIDIEAKLPGRREQGLSLLSGGERSLTAVALIFSLLKVSPTPFCVLDEVDAMLDEANVGRFTELLKELSRETQFIVITHNRNTVQVADVIYGVTMGRDSASQVISLRLDELDDSLVK